MLCWLKECSSEFIDISLRNTGPITKILVKNTGYPDLKPSYKDRAKESEETVIPTSSNHVLTREKEIFSSKALFPPSGKLILDFGQNLAGYVDICVKGEKGQKVSLWMGEILDEDGELALKNIQVMRPAKNFDFDNQMKVMMGNYDAIKEELVCSPLQEIHLTLSGEEDHYRTKYALWGFRYAEVVSDGEIEPSCFQAVAVYSDMDPLGKFECSNEKANRLFVNVKGVQLGEWLEPKEFQDVISAGNLSEHPEECTAYMHYTMSVMEKAAALIKKEEDRVLFEEYAKGARKSYQWMFLRDGAPDTDRQSW